MNHSFRLSVLFILLGSVAFADDKPNETRTLPSRTWHGNVADVREQKNLPATGRIDNIWGTQATTVFITSRRDLQELWKTLRRDDKLPEIDFTKETLIVTPQRATQLMIIETNGKALLAFSTARPMGLEQAYTIAAFPKGAVESVLRRPK